MLLPSYDARELPRRVAGLTMVRRLMIRQRRSKLEEAAVVEEEVWGSPQRPVWVRM